MVNLITWFDLENVILENMYAGSWPEGMIGVSVYPDEIDVRLKSEDDRLKASESLQQWFGAKYFKQEEKIYLDFSSNGEKRFLDVSFEIEPLGQRIIPETMKPNFATISLYPEAPGLKGPDFEKLGKTPSIWAFYSFKGGVSRTLHLISLVKALSEQEPPKKVLIVDADLEAPGLTWWAEEQLGRPEISFLDFLALAHYDDSDDYADAMKITADKLRRQMLVFETGKTKVEHFFLPAFREIEQLMRMPIRPENVCWESGKEWIIPELLWKLGKTLDVHAIVVDLRAGLSEISSPILFDPRVNRIIVTTPSGQSVEGTTRVLDQIKKISRTLKQNDSDYESHVPTVILSMIKKDLINTPELKEIRKQLKENIFPGNNENEQLSEKEVLLESMFDENLLYLKNLKGTLEKLDTTDTQKLMIRVAKEWLSYEAGGEELLIRDRDEIYKADLEILRDTAKDYEFAESGKAGDFLITQNLKNIARKFESAMPVGVIMGPKGSGKTYTYLQFAHLKKWSEFVKKVGEKIDADYDGFIWPLLASRGLGEEAKKIIDDCRHYAVDMNGESISFKLSMTRDFEDLLNRQKETGRVDLSSWREFWFRFIARSISCENEQDPLGAMQDILKKKNGRVIFQIDGLEEHFQDFGKDTVEQVAIRALCQSVVDALQEWPDNRIGLLIFIRKDIVKSAIQQNFGQFESLYRMLELKWDREEALRLVAWMVNDVAKLKNYADYEPPIENISGSAIEEILKKFWGYKLGPLHSREAFTSNWVITALSDYNGQLQARDLVRLIRFAADNALNPKMARYPDRLLPPSAVRNALKPCSEKKIDEIQQEIVILKDIFAKLMRIPQDKKQIPFDMNEMGLSADEIEVMKKLGIVKVDEGKYYLTEIIRWGLGFRLIRGRPKVIS